jgi:hypothetical protein
MSAPEISEARFIRRESKRERERNHVIPQQNASWLEENDKNQKKRSQCVVEQWWEKSSRQIDCGRPANGDSIGVHRWHIAETSICADKSRADKYMCRQTVRCVEQYVGQKVHANHLGRVMLDG